MRALVPVMMLALASASHDARAEFVLSQPGPADPTAASPPTPEPPIANPCVVAPRMAARPRIRERHSFVVRRQTDCAAGRQGHLRP
jgi:hypothetical protein